MRTVRLALILLLISSSASVWAQSSTVASWTAESQTPGGGWSNSGWDNRSFRILLEGTSVISSGSSVQITLRGRTSGSYTVQRVSLAKRDGVSTNIVTGTNQQVTFGGLWDDGVLVPAGGTVTSNPIPFDLLTGEDLFLTYWVPAGNPTVYKTGGSSTSAWSIAGADESTTLDWGSLTISNTLDYVYIIEQLDVLDAAPAAPGVTLLDPWVVDGTYGSQNATFDVSAGMDRLVLVAISAENNQNGLISVQSVSLGDQVLTEVHDFTVGSSTAYHNLHWFGYLLESEIAARIGSALTIWYANAPSNPFDEPKIHYASYENVDQTTPIADSISNSSTNASSLPLGIGLTAGVGDKIIGFNVLGQHYTPGVSTAGYTRVSQSIGSTNGHASAVFDRTVTTSITENPTFTSSSGTRIAVSAVVLTYAAAVVNNDPR